MILNIFYFVNQKKKKKRIYFILFCSVYLYSFQVICLFTLSKGFKLRMSYLQSKAVEVCQ